MSGAGSDGTHQPPQGAPADWRRAALEPPRAHGALLGSATLKRSPEDFTVDEQLPFVADGGAAHVLLKVRKREQDTLEVARSLARIANVEPREVGFAGLKDRVAVATQWFSIPARLAPADWHGQAGPGFEVLEAAAHSRKLRRGALLANTFRVVLRGLAVDAGELEQRLAAIVARGVPNYFGPQRFGREGGNLDSLARWCAGGHLPRGREARAFVLSAGRALAFNAVLGRRVADGSWATLLAGERVNLDGSNSWFVAAAIDTELKKRLVRLDVHPTGPLPGRAAKPDDSAPAVERAVLAEFAGLATRLEGAGLEAARRPLRVMPRDFAATRRGPTLTLDFALPAGSFATAVVREIAATERPLGESDDA
jgi:tRNA pseudouridine13 synthase